MRPKKTAAKGAGPAPPGESVTIPPGDLSDIRLVDVQSAMMAKSMTAPTYVPKKLAPPVTSAAAQHVSPTGLGLFASFPGGAPPKGMPQSTPPQASSGSAVPGAIDVAETQPAVDEIPATVPHDHGSIQEYVTSKEFELFG